MTNTLLEKLKRSRQTNIEVGGFTFVVQRPTQVDFNTIPRESGTYTDDEGKAQTAMFPVAEETLRRFVVGWQGVKEIDLVPGGNSVEAAFDTDLMMEWLKERTDIWYSLPMLIWKAFTDHRQQVSEEVGKQEAGSTNANSQPASQG